MEEKGEGKRRKGRKRKEKRGRRKKGRRMKEGRGRKGGGGGEGEDRKDETKEGRCGGKKDGKVIAHIRFIESFLCVRHCSGAFYCILAYFTYTYL